MTGEIVARLEASFEAETQVARLTTQVEALVQRLDRIHDASTGVAPATIPERNP